METLQKLVVHHKDGQSEFTINDTSAVSYAEQQDKTDAQKAQARENIGAISAADLPRAELAVAKFETQNGGESYYSTSHTARQLTEILRNNTPVIAFLLDVDSGTQKCVFCFSNDRENAVYIGEAIQDGGWAHYFGESIYYGNGDETDQAMGNEIWLEY